MNLLVVNKFSGTNPTTLRAVEMVVVAAVVVV